MARGAVAAALVALGIAALATSPLRADEPRPAASAEPAPDAPRRLHTTDGEPILGRLKTHSGTLDLTVHAVGPAGPIGPDAHAHSPSAELDARHIRAER